MRPLPAVHGHSDSDGRRTARRGATKFGRDEGESLEAWLLRLCRTLPALKPVTHGKIDDTVAAAAGKLSMSVPNVVQPNRATLLVSERAAFQSDLLYEEFVAIVGVQLLLTSRTFGKRKDLQKGGVTLESAAKRAGKMPGSGLSKANLIHVLLACEVRGPMPFRATLFELIDARPPWSPGFAECSFCSEACRFRSRSACVLR